MDRKHNDLIGDILDASGEKDNYNYKGKGKPLPKSYMQKDILQNFQEIAKDAGYVPPWLKLQKEISLLVHTAKNEKDIKVINKKIRKYNTMCPFSMQKRPVQLSELEQAKKVW
ncbi:DnaJ family domain-containing protein [Virgibacillus kimchii]